MEFSRQESWGGLPFPIPGDLPDPRIELAFLTSPALASRLFTTAAPGKPKYLLYIADEKFPFLLILLIIHMKLLTAFEAHSSLFLSCLIQTNQ